MTRETKIGLLVGLAFIIVIGILLSDHLTSTTEPPQAALAQAGRDVRSAVAVPGGASAPVTQVQIPQQVAPAAPVATREELAPRPAPVTVVRIGPAPQTQPSVTTPQQVATAASNSQTPQPVTEQDPAANNGKPTAPEGPTGPSTLERVAQTFNEPVVAVGQQQTNSQTAGQPTNQQPVAAVAGKQYKAEPGDSVTKIASKMYGTSTKATRQLIIDANATLKQNPDKVIVGKTYIIPNPPIAQTAASPAPAPAPTAQPATPKLADQVVVVEDPKPAKFQPANAPIASTPEHLYTVKSGDTLRKIAVEQLGNVDAVSAILELNKDKVKDANSIQANMKLRLPAKSIAMAQ